MVVTHDIGAERTSRRTAAGVGVTAGPDGSLPHEAHVGFGGLPRARVRLHPDDDALIDVEGVECRDIPRDEVPAFHSVAGRARPVTGTRAPVVSRETSLAA